MSDLIKVHTPPCPRCKSIATWEITQEQYDLYTSGASSPSQIFPERTADDWERLLTGLCGKCWDIVIPEPED